MSCQICTNYDHSVSFKYTNCLIQCLEKIKLHYMDMVKKFGENNLVINNLQESNSKLQAKLEYYERANGENPVFKFENDGSESFSDVLENEILNKTVESLNVALNDESDFETSYVSDSPNNLKKQKLLKREPMKPITSANNTIDNSKSFCESKQGFLKFQKGCTLKENKSCLSKHNSRKNERNSQERPKLSLKSNHLRQRRLQVNPIKKTLGRDTVFDDETKEPILCDSVSNINKISRNAFSRQDSQDDNIFELSTSSQKKIITKENSITQQNETETPSVMILTPETQDIIFLDDSCESNIESMDLLRDFIRPPDERLKNLKIFESNRIRLLQKTASSKTIGLDNNENLNGKECSNPVLENLVEANINELSSASNGLEETNLCVLNNKTVSLKDNRLLRLNCDECQKYIKYLGARLSDEEIEKHLRNCTKHKINIETPSTPDGFWDPKIKPLDKNDPRNKTLIDTRFQRK